MVLDPQTQQYVQQNRDIAGGLAGNIFNRPESFFGGPNYQMMQGVGGLQGAAGQAGQLANLGFGMGGAGAGNFLQGQGAAGLGPLINQIVGPQIQSMLPKFAQDQQLAALRNDQNATAQGAFGGSRQEIGAQQAIGNQRDEQNRLMAQLTGGAAGQGLGFLGQQQGQNLQLANLGFGQAGRGIGMGGQFANQMFGQGQGLLGIENQRRQEDLFRAQQGMGLRQGAIGPYGSTQTTHTPSNKFGSALGGATTGFGVGGPLGAGIGGAAGLLFG